MSSQKIRAFNKKFLSRDHTTDVLAFDMCEGGFSRKENIPLLGDIIISTDAAIQNAKIFKTSVKHEIVLYIIHGILHLLGYDDHKSRDIRLMREREQELLEKTGIGHVLSSKALE